MGVQNVLQFETSPPRYILRLVDTAVSIVVINLLVGFELTFVMTKMFLLDYFTNTILTLVKEPPLILPFLQPQGLQVQI